MQVQVQVQVQVAATWSVTQVRQSLRWSSDRWRQVESSEDRWWGCGSARRRQVKKVTGDRWSRWLTFPTSPLARVPGLVEVEPG